MRYKVGDKVRIKSAEALLQLAGKGNKFGDDIVPDGEEVWFVESMWDLCGLTVVIQEVIEDECYKVTDGRGYHFADYMLEPAEDEKYEPDYDCSKCHYFDSQDNIYPCASCRGTEIQSHDRPWLWSDKPLEHDPVSHPEHYTYAGIECIQVIEAATSGLTGIEAFCTGNAIKYLWRWKHKNGIEDLRKAIWYINHMIEKEESE